MNLKQYCVLHYAFFYLSPEEPKAGSSKRPRSKKIKYEDDDSSDEDEPIAKSRPKKASVKKDDGDDDDKPLSKTLEAKKKLASKKAIRVKGPPVSSSPLFFRCSLPLSIAVHMHFKAFTFSCTEAMPRVFNDPLTG